MVEAGWLKAMSNGALGEARIRALLLDRFHVMVRSVDIDGADFLIQLRSSGRFTDLLAPRLGIIQSKFAQDDSTGHFLPIEYAVVSGTPLEEFFVIVTVGHEDSVENYLLSASDVATLKIKKNNGRDVYHLSAIARKKFKQNTVAGMLNRIENTLKQRTEAQNNKFLRSINVPDFEFKRRSLDNYWIIPIPNERGFIPDILYIIRIMLRDQIYSFDDMHSAIARVLTEGNVDICVREIRAILEDQLIEDDGVNVRLVRDMARLPALRDDLIAAVEIHHRRMKTLEQRGQLDRFMDAIEKIGTKHMKFFESNNTPRWVSTPDGNSEIADDLAVTCVAFDPTTNDIKAVNTVLTRAGPPPASKSGLLIRSRELWRHALEGDQLVWRELQRLKIELLGDYLGLLLPDESVGSPALPNLAVE